MPLDIRGVGDGLLDGFRTIDQFMTNRERAALADKRMAAEDKYRQQQNTRQEKQLAIAEKTANASINASNQQAEANRFALTQKRQQAQLAKYKQEFVMDTDRLALIDVNKKQPMVGSLCSLLNTNR